MKLTSLVGSPWILVAIALAGFTAGAALARWHYAPRLELARLHAETFGSLLREQNRGIQALKEEQVRRHKEADKQLARARGEADVHRRHAERIMSLTLPPGADACMASCALIDAEVGP
jgi:ribulose 1,5-bisphosphate carboxylase large subunit-like protein